MPTYRLRDGAEPRDLFPIGVRVEAGGTIDVPPDLILSDPDFDLVPAPAPAPAPAKKGE